MTDAKRPRRARKQPDGGAPAGAPAGLEVRRVRAADLAANPRNARLHTPRNLDLIETSLREFGQVEPLVARELGGALVLLGGHGRLEVMVHRLGWELVDVVVVDPGTDLRADRLGFLLNRPGEVAAWDADVLAALAEDAPDPNELFGGIFTDDELTALLDPPDPPDPPKPPARPPPPPRDVIPAPRERKAGEIPDHKCPACGHLFEDPKIGPFWLYYGAKHAQGGAYPMPVQGIPIVEPFAGAAGYASRYGAGREVILCDLDPVIAGIWRWLIQASPEEIRAIPDVPDGGNLRDIMPDGPARDLAGFWCSGGAFAPITRPTAWGRDSYARLRERVAQEVHHIRRWTVLEGSYESLPDIEATWFVDPPYQGRAGAKYRRGSKEIDYASLGEWCRTRRGLTIVCDAVGADWLDWRASRPLTYAAHPNRKPPPEDVIWCSDTAAIGPWWKPIPRAT